MNVGGEPEGVDLRPDGAVVYVTSEEDSEVFAIDTATDEVVAQVRRGARPRSTAFLPDGSRAYVTCENGGSVAVVDARNTRPQEDQPDRREGPADGPVAAPDGRHVYVTTGRGESVVAIDTATNQPAWSVEVGTRPWGVAIAPDG